MSKPSESSTSSLSPAQCLTTERLAAVFECAQTHVHLGLCLCYLISSLDRLATQLLLLCTFPGEDAEEGPGSPAVTNVWKWLIVGLYGGVPSKRSTFILVIRYLGIKES